MAYAQLSIRFALVLSLTSSLVIGSSSLAQDDDSDTAETSQSEELRLPPAVPPAAVTDPKPSEGDLGYEAMTKGPIHEAFATPIDVDPSDGVRLYADAPPNPIVEQPPADRPDGKSIVWVPGYWAWSDDDDKYVWVSGLYRKAPHGRTWVKGYWSELDSKYRWTRGYWAAAESDDGAVDEPEYLPIPPKSVDNGPSSQPPGEDYFWLPGQYEYVEGDYQWRSGYWTKHYEGWVWQPACYIVSPKGCIYVDGYWDVLPSKRGQLYAPVVFNSSIYAQPRYVYCPSYPLANTATLLTYLFVRSGYPNYYYGNFFGPAYASIGYRPWYDARSVISPWIGYYDWNYRRSGIDFVGSMQRYKKYYGVHPPSRDFTGAIRTGITPHDVSRRISLGGSLDEVVRRNVAGQPFKTLDPTRFRSTHIYNPSFSTPNDNPNPPLGRTVYPKYGRRANTPLGGGLDTVGSTVNPLGRTAYPKYGRRANPPLGRGLDAVGSTVNPPLGRSVSPPRGNNPSSSYGRRSSYSVNRTPSSTLRTPKSSIGRTSSSTLGRTPSSTFGRSSSSSVNRLPSSSLRSGGVSGIRSSSIGGGGRFGTSGTGRSSIGGASRGRGK